MQFEYLVIADAASNGPEGKVNALGIGVRVVNLDHLPNQASMTILGSVSASLSEAGPYDVRVAMIAPDGSRDVLAQGLAEVPSQVPDIRVPTGLAFGLPGVRTFNLEGVYTVEAQVGELIKTYEFVVRLVPKVAPPKPRRKNAPAKSRALAASKAG
jgi:hypothetical protein